MFLAFETGSLAARRVEETYGLKVENLALNANFWKVLKPLGSVNCPSMVVNEQCGTNMGRTWRKTLKIGDKMELSLQNSMELLLCSENECDGQYFGN